MPYTRWILQPLWEGSLIGAPLRSLEVRPPRNMTCFLVVVTLDDVYIVHDLRTQMKEPIMYLAHVEKWLEQKELFALYGREIKCYLLHVESCQVHEMEHLLKSVFRPSFRSMKL